jgi:hypothetical protein
LSEDYLQCVARALYKAYYASDAIECGKQLLKAKQAVGHGKFGAWLIAYAPFGRVMASRYMALARPDYYHAKNGKPPQWHP